MKKIINVCIPCLILFTIIYPTIIVNAEIVTNPPLVSLSPPNQIIKNTEDNSDSVVEVFSQGKNNLNITKSDIDLMAKLVYAESRGEPFEGKVAVASVVLNRVLSPKFPNTIKGVIFEPNAFSCVKNNNIIAYPDQKCYDAVYQAIKGTDPTHEALFFYNPKISTCSWMKAIKKIDSLTIGQHTFFKD
jgi:N-acetylmuramoyl-L-alanine amidase